VAKPLISIVMPVYNGSHSITKVIASLLRQTYKNFELIIVNDGSTDDTLRLISKFKDPRISLFTYKKNRGICYALNVGFLKSKGEFIARADGDDKSMPQRFQRQLSFLTSHPDYDVCGTFQNILRNKKIYKSPTAVTHKEILTSLVFGPTMKHSSIMLRRSCLNSFGKNIYKKNFFLCEDYELWMRLSRHSKFYNLPEYLVDYDWNTVKAWEKSNVRLDKSLKNIYVQALNNLFFYKVSRKTADIHMRLISGNLSKLTFFDSFIFCTLHSISLILHFSIRKDYSFNGGLKIVIVSYLAIFGHMLSNYLGDDLFLRLKSFIKEIL